MSDVSYQMHIYLRWDPDIYFDVNDLPDPFTINIPLGITNNENSTLYFKATLVNPSSDWSDYDQQLGSVDSGASSYFIYTLKRAQPTLTDGEYDETITLKIEAYTDDTYSTLYGSKTVDITIHFFDHSDPSWTVLYHDDFDDGTTQGWSSSSGTVEGYSHGSIELTTDHYVSAPYSLSETSSIKYYAHKSYDIGNYTKARMIIHAYVISNAAFALMIGDKLVVEKRLAYHGIPKEKWVRLCFDMPVNTTVEVKWAASSAGSVYFDEIFVIAK